MKSAQTVTAAVETHVSPKVLHSERRELVTCFHVTLFLTQVGEQPGPRGLAFRRLHAVPADLQFQEPQWDLQRLRHAHRQFDLKGDVARGVPRGRGD